MSRAFVGRFANPRGAVANPDEARHRPGAHFFRTLLTDAHTHRVLTDAYTHRVLTDARALARALASARALTTSTQTRCISNPVHSLPPFPLALTRDLPNASTDPTRGVRLVLPAQGAGAPRVPARLQARLRRAAEALQAVQLAPRLAATYPGGWPHVRRPRCLPHRRAELHGHPVVSDGPAGDSTTRTGSRPRPPPRPAAAPSGLP